MSHGEEGPQPETVGGVAELYLGNILYALEFTAHAMEEQSKADHAAFYRGIARKLAEAHGRTKQAPRAPQGDPSGEQ